MEVYKNPNLGFSIAGGIDSGTNPFHPNDNKVCEKWRLSFSNLRICGTDFTGICLFSPRGHSNEFCNLIGS